MPRARRAGAAVLSVWLTSALWPSLTHAQASALPAAAAGLVDGVRQGAARRLRSVECRQVLSDFTDGQGRSLVDRLAVFALPPDEYLGRLALLDGSALRLCRAGQAELFTTPGSARVLVCPSFLKTAWRDRTAAEVYLIHEMLHTLGLGEDPPTQRQITAQVERRCAP